MKNNTACSESILEYLVEKQPTADLLKVAPRTLDRWHTQRKGPPRFQIGGKVVYDLRDVIAWAEEQKRKTTLY